MFTPSASTPANASADDKQARRLEAVLALLGGESASQVAARFSICRSDLYKFRRRALSAIAGAFEDHKRGPHLPHNHLSQPHQARVAALCARYPTASSYQIYRRMGATAPSARTIQRVRQRLRLPRLPKRASPQRTAKRLSSAAKRKARALLRAKPYLGPQRLS